MVKTTRQQREALARVFARIYWPDNPTKDSSYLKFRRGVQPGPGCIMVQFAGMWLGIEPDGYTHS